MKPTLIALKGRAKSGKTATLKLVKSHLERRSGARILIQEMIGKLDLRAVIVIGDTKVGITTEGDPGGALEETLELFLKEGCLILICPCRVRRSTRDVVRKYKLSLRVRWTKQEYVCDSRAAQAEAHARKANEILAMVDEEENRSQ